MKTSFLLALSRFNREYAALAVEWALLWSIARVWHWLGTDLETVVIEVSPPATDGLEYLLITFLNQCTVQHNLLAREVYGDLAWEMHLAIFIMANS